MSQQRDVGVGQGAVRVSERRSGIVGPILCTVTFFVQGLFRLEEYDPVAEVVSALEARGLGAAGELRRVRVAHDSICGLLLGVSVRVGQQQPASETPAYNHAL